jgi:hypothetical protein
MSQALQLTPEQPYYFNAPEPHEAVIMQAMWASDWEQFTHMPSPEEEELLKAINLVSDTLSILSTRCAGHTSNLYLHSFPLETVVLLADHFKTPLKIYYKKDGRLDFMSTVIRKEAAEITVISISPEY